MLVGALQQGDRSALAALYDRHASRMLGVAYRILQDRRDAEDVVHDVFIEVWHKAASYNADRGTVIAWLMTRLRSRAVDRARALALARQHAMAASSRPAQAVEQSSATGRLPEFLSVHQALEQLTEVQRTVLELAYFRGMTYQDIAAQCAIPLGTVRSRLATAIMKLRRILLSKEEGDTHAAR
jgi:RNA polymerase sigma-70 factor (ECF subfamily)